VFDGVVEGQPLLRDESSWRTTVATKVFVVLATRKCAFQGIGAVESAVRVPMRAVRGWPLGPSTLASTFTSPPSAFRTAARS
jgi:hypothetical protein